MKQTIAERKVAGKKRLRFASLLVCIPFGLLFYFFKFVVPGYSFLALVCLCIAGLILFYTLMPVVGLVFPGFARVLTAIVSTALVAGLLVAAGTEAIIIKASFGSPEVPVDYLVVLGAKVNEEGPSVSLQDRITGAYGYLAEHPEVIAVLSGGKGEDEPISEAQCMFQELTALGIPAERLWLEDRATNTWENIHFSLEVIREKTGETPRKLGVLSSEDHLFRASLFAQANGVEFVGVPARTSRPSQMLNHFLREVAGVWHYILLGGRYHD